MVMGLNLRARINFPFEIFKQHNLKIILLRKKCYMRYYFMAKQDESVPLNASIADYDTLTSGQLRALSIYWTQGAQAVVNLVHIV